MTVARVEVLPQADVLGERGQEHDKAAKVTVAQLRASPWSQHPAFAGRHEPPPPEEIVATLLVSGDAARNHTAQIAALLDAVQRPLEAWLACWRHEAAWRSKPREELDFLDHIEYPTPDHLLGAATPYLESAARMAEHHRSRKALRALMRRYRELYAACRFPAIEWCMMDAPVNHLVELLAGDLRSVRLMLWREAKTLARRAPRVRAGRPPKERGQCEVIRDILLKASAPLSPKGIALEAERLGTPIRNIRATLTRAKLKYSRAVIPGADDAGDRTYWSQPH